MKSVHILCATFLCVALSAAKVAADVPNPGFNSLFIGHSFFKPFADEMPAYSAAAGITGHTQTVVFSGGATGAPQALWENASKRAEIQAVLDAGDVELFGMTYHPDYPTTAGYKNWIDYALAKNPRTRFFVALPWINYPNSFTTINYNNLWHAYQPQWQDFIDSLRALYPGVDIYSIPYGQSAVELRNLFSAGNLPDVQQMIGASTTSIYTDTLGHPGNILRDLGRLVWLSAIYDVDLSTYSYGPFYNTDLKAIAQAIMAGHDPNYDAAYHVDTDDDRVGDSLDNCPSTANPDQLDTDGNGIGNACQLPPGC